MRSLKAVKVVGSAVPRRSYNFASSKYADSFGNWDVPQDVSHYRDLALKCKADFDPKAWYNEPIVTHLLGEKLTVGTSATTTDACNRENGAIVHADAATVDKVIDHMRTFRPPQKDFRNVVREVEQLFLGDKYAGTLIFNQAMDFGKQDGCTEIVESVEANTVERRLNDKLLADEEAGVLVVRRDPSIAGCVSNFSNFLDLFRKTIRSLEVGVPVVVFSRNNTAQYMYRWFVLLEKELSSRGFPAGMLTFAALSIADQRRVMEACPASPMNFTGSREIAAQIKQVNPLLCASTGGPNTMVVTDWTPAVQESVQMSAAIESSGQCTAMRHLVAPVASKETLDCFNKTRLLDSALDALKVGEFAGIVRALPVQHESGYEEHQKVPVSVRSSDRLPPDNIDEHWRGVFLDVTTKPAEEVESDSFVNELSAWLVKHQPISFVVNHKTRSQAYALMERYFRRSGLCVYTIGTVDKPALTAQARPQVGEIFGEVPPRNELQKYTRFPVMVPSSTPSYNSCYSPSYLTSLATNPEARAAVGKHKSLLSFGETAEQGYVLAVAQHIRDAAVGARRGYDSSSRTALWGLQRPPLGLKVVIRIDADSDPAYAAAHLVPFVLTNACEDVVLSVHTSRRGLPIAQQSNGWEVTVEDDVSNRTDVWAVVNVAAKCDYALAGQFTTRLVSFGHIKSVYAEDDQFVKALSASEKWLRSVE